MVFYKSFAEAFKNLPAEEYKSLMVAVFEYAMDEIEPEGLSVYTEAMFELVKPQIDANNRRYENGKKGGNKNQTKTNKQPTSNQQATKSEPKVNHISTKNEPNDNDNVNDNENENVNVNGDIYRDVPEEIKDVYMEWVKMRKKIKKPITSKTTVTRSLNRLRSLSKDPAEQRELIQVAIDHCWQSFYHKPREDTKNRKADELDGFYKMSQEWANE